MDLKFYRTLNTLAFGILIAFISIGTSCHLYAEGNASPSHSDTTSLENPVDTDYLKSHLSQASTKLVLTPEISRNLKAKVKSDPLVSNVYEALKLKAEEIQSRPLLERIMTGRRLLSVSREMLYRMNILGMVYHIDKEDKILDRINEEILAVCDFTDWNPSHYLDVAEMALAVAIGLDWTEGDLPESTISTAKTALIKKGIDPSYEGKRWWINGDNNWNQVCNGGMIAASIMIADQDPELAAKTIHRSLEGMPHALAAYGPDGVYPEGATYWSYGTSFSVITASILESAFGTDFGISEFPAFKESALFRKISEAPSGRYYNFADCGDGRGPSGDMTLAWFAKTYDEPLFFEKDRFLKDPTEMGNLSRLAGAGLVWLSQFDSAEKESKLPEAWSGKGDNPVVFFRNDEEGYFFGGKGGRGTVNHGNMDAGSFVWELDGIRWVIDPGNQSYHALEKTGFNLWGSCQECERWTLLTKNNYGHSTITVNDQLHVVDGYAALEEFHPGSTPSATFDLTPAFGGLLDHLSRTFIKDGPGSLVIEDRLTTNDQTKLVTWQLMTTADVIPMKGAAVLKQEGQEVRLEVISHPDLQVSVVSLDPPPMELDRQIEGLKRIELRIPAWTFENMEGNIKVRLAKKE